mgnify:CR=1 FL=1
MSLTTQSPFYKAKQLKASDKKHLALKSMDKSQHVTELANAHKVSRKFIYQQQRKAMEAVNDAFDDTKDKKNEHVLFYLPVTFSWLCQLILCLVLHCRASHRGIKKLLTDVFDHDISVGTIHTIVNDAKSNAKRINAKQNLSNIKLAAQDEMFHANKPILTGVDIRSLYCYLLTPENDRQFDTWGTHLLDLQNQGLNPERMFGDDASALRAAHRYVYPDIPYDIDNFHIISELMDMRRFFRNSLKSSTTKRLTLQKKVAQSVLSPKNESYQAKLDIAKAEEKEMIYLSKTIDTLVQWMQHDVLNMPGVAPDARYELFDFVLMELEQLAKQHPHRIKSVCTTLRNEKYFLLAFTQVLDDKFQAIADEYVFPVNKIWDMCQLQRCKHSSDNYAVRSLPLHDYFGTEFDVVEDNVLHALDTTERTSSMIENLHSRLKPYFYLRREIGFGYTDLLRFYLNHTPLLRSARQERQGKTPTELLTGSKHEHWLELLGFQRFKKAA